MADYDDNLYEEESTGRLMYYVLALLITAVLAMGATYYQVALQEADDVKYVQQIGDQRVLSQQLAKLAGEAARGIPDASSALEEVRDKFDTTLNWQAGHTPEETREPLKQLQASWAEYRNNINTILERRELISKLYGHVQNVNSQLPKLFIESEAVVETLAEQKAPANQVYIATRQLMLAQRIHNSVNRIMSGDGDEAKMAANHFGVDAQLFGRVIEDMLRGNRNMGIRSVTDPTSRDKLQKLSKQFSVLRGHVAGILEKPQEMIAVSNAAKEAQGLSSKILEQVHALSESYEEATKNRIYPLLVYLFAGITLLSIISMGYLFLRESRVRLAESEESHQVMSDTTTSNQEAILRLLDEMGDLADGDLTVTATVTEDITGAIADSINYAIDALRQLVSAINNTTQQVSSAAQQTQATAMHLAEASDHQAQQITGASAAINEMATSIDAVSDNAAELAEEAKRSVSIASTGSEAVQRTIHGMDTIRGQIQETSKRIKRLGESSQEIGDIVELINDIAEQTNILALNAAIQAAMAGEAGRGFAVVADEVQRLAERSADATRQIDALVTAIQSDTNEAVASMEQSTIEVVNGAKLAQDAGAALEATESVSTHLAELITNISDSARQQAGAATNISDTMNVIQEITTQTSAGTNETAASIGNLAELANELRHSVAGFRLPQ